MEDNYYKRGKEGQPIWNQPNVPAETRSSAPTTTSKGHSKAQHHGSRQAAGGTLKAKFHDLGKGRIVESSQSCFAIQHHEPKHQQAASEQWKPEPLVDETDQTIKASGPLIGKQTTANSNHQRRGGRHSHDHFATQHQTPQSVMTKDVSASGGPSTPLTHLIQRRQFEMTQLPKSNSVVNAATDNNMMGSQQHQVLSIHLQNPKITSQTMQRLTESSSKKILGVAREGSGHLEKNTSSLSGDALHSHPHSRKGSTQMITGKPSIAKPQGGVFQSGPDKMKTHHILTNNFVSGHGHQTAESPKFMLNSHEKMTFAQAHAEQAAASSKGGKTGGGWPPEQLKSEGNVFNLEKQQLRPSTHSNCSNLQSAQKSHTNNQFSSALSGQIAPLFLNQQHSCGALGQTTTSHFNTPSNCYQAQQQQNFQLSHNIGETVGYPRPSILKEQIILHADSQSLNPLSQTSYEMTAPLHISNSHANLGANNRHSSITNLIGNTHHNSNSTLIANLAHQAQNTSSQNMPLLQTTANNNSQAVNFTQHTQQAHPNLQAAVQLQQQKHSQGGANAVVNPNSLSNSNNVNIIGGQGHLSASQFDISALLRQHPSASQPVFDFQELCSNTTHHAGHQTQANLKQSLEATSRDVDYLRQRFYAEYGYDTNDILTLHSYWQSNFQSFVQNAGNQTTAINALQIANLSSFRQNLTAQQLTIFGPSAKSNNVTAFGVGNSRHKAINQHTTINFNSQSFDNQTMTTSHIQPRKVSNLLETQIAAPSNVITTQTGPTIKEAIGGQDSTEIQHFTTGSVGAGYTPFDMNQQMFFIASNTNQQSQDMQHLKGRRTQPCLRQHSIASNRQNITDTVSFHRDVPTPIEQREALASIEAEDEKNDFSFEEPAFDGTNEHSIEDEEKSLINALSFKKQITPLQDGQHLHELENNQRGWATVKQDSTALGLPKYRNTRPLSKDHCGFTIQLSPINRFAPSPRSKRSIFDFHALKFAARSMLQKGICSAKDRIKSRGSSNKDGARKFLHQNLSLQTKALSLLTRSGNRPEPLSTVFRLKTALEIIFLQSGSQLAQMDLFRRLLPRRSKDFDSNENKTVTYRDARNQSDAKRRREKSTKGRGTSKSRKRQGSRNSRKQRIASLYRESTSSIGDESASIPIFTHLSKQDLEQLNPLRSGFQVVQDAETTQDIQKLCREIEEAEKNFADKINQDEDQFDKQMTRHVVQAERALQESKRESITREKSLKGTRRASQTSLADQMNFKAQSMSSLNQAMQLTPNLAANATHRHLNPSDLYGTKGISNLAHYAQTNDPAAAPNTERPNAQAIEMRLAMHHQTVHQNKRVDEDESNIETDITQRPKIKVQQAKVQSKSGKRMHVVSLLDQKSEPCLLKPKKLSLERQQVKLFNQNAGKMTMPNQKEADSVATDDIDYSKTPKTGANLQSTNSMKRKLTYIKTKNINFHSVSKLSGRIQASATSTHQGAPGLRIKLQKTTNGDSTDRSGPEMRFAAQNTCQSALASHKHIGRDLAARTNELSGQAVNTVLFKKVSNLQTDQSDNGVTPDKPSGKIKYASARIKLLRVDSSQEKAHNKTEDSMSQAYHQLKQPPVTAPQNKEHDSPTNSDTSTLGGIPHIRRLVEMLINEFYRKRGKSIKTVSRDKQVDTLVEFWWQSLSQQKILCKLKGKLAKTGLVDKEKHLMNFLNGKDTKSIFLLQKHSTTRKYGELAVLEEKILRRALEDYLNRSQ